MFSPLPILTPATSSIAVPRVVGGVLALRARRVTFAMPEPAARFGVVADVQWLGV
jgi:hypothetical protein